MVLTGVKDDCDDGINVTIVGRLETIACPTVARACCCCCCCCCCCWCCWNWCCCSTCNRCGVVAFAPETIPAGIVVVLFGTIADARKRLLCVTGTTVCVTITVGFTTVLRICSLSLFAVIVVVSALTRAPPPPFLLPLLVVEPFFTWFGFDVITLV